MSNRPQRWCSRFFLVSILIYASPEIPAQSIPVGAAYVGSGYDVLFGNPDGATFTSGGIDPGLKPAKFVLQKTFKERSGYCPGEATCVEVGGTLSEETFSLHADLQQYKDDITALWTTDTDAGVRNTKRFFPVQGTQHNNWLNGSERLVQLAVRRLTTSRAPWNNRLLQNANCPQFHVYFSESGRSDSDTVQRYMKSPQFSIFYYFRPWRFYEVIRIHCRLCVLKQTSKQLRIQFARRTQRLPSESFPP